MNEKLIKEKLANASQETGESNLSWVRWVCRMSQMELGVKTGIVQSRISYFERGLALPSDAELARMAEVLGVKPDDLVFKLQK